MYIEAQLQSAVQSELDPGERLLWAGRPAPMRLMLPSVGAFFFGVIWSSFIVNFIVMWYGFPGKRHTDSSGLWGFHGIAIGLFFVPFVLVGAGMLLSPVWAYLSAKRTVYAITDKRVLVIEGGRSRKVQSYGEGDLGNIERVERSDRTGDLTFAQKPYKDSDGDQRIKDVKLVGIADVRSVENLLRDTFVRKA